MNDYDKYYLLPSYSVLKSRSDVDLTTQLDRHKLSIPIIASPMSTVCEETMAYSMDTFGGIGIIHRYMSIDEQVRQVTSLRASKANVGAAFSSNDWPRVQALLDAGVTLLMGDVAHGDSQAFYGVVDRIKYKHAAVTVVSANVVTVGAARRSIDAGCNVLRVGIGAGSVCKTRDVTGVGRNTIDALLSIRNYHPTVKMLACGGFRNSGDIVKALAAGASGVILGRLLATCNESSAPRLNDGSIIYAGMASYFAEDLRAERSNEDPSTYRQTAAEGTQEILPATGLVSETLARLAGGIRAGMAYLGAKDIPSLWAAAKFEEV